MTLSTQKVTASRKMLLQKQLFALESRMQTKLEIMCRYMFVECSSALLLVFSSLDETRGWK